MIQNLKYKDLYKHHPLFYKNYNSHIFQGQQENIKISDTYLPKEFHPILERLTEIDPFILNGVQSIGKNKILEIKRRTI